MSINLLKRKPRDKPAAYSLAEEREMGELSAFEGCNKVIDVDRQSRFIYTILTGDGICNILLLSAVTPIF